jgi:hypothetical protein
MESMKYLFNHPHFLLSASYSIVEFSQADPQKTETEIAATDEYQYRLTQIVLAFTISAPK